MQQGVPARRSSDGPLIVALLALILTVALVLRGWGIGWGLYGATVARRPHPDEWVVFWVFHWFGQYRNLSTCPRVGSECFFDWGTAYLYLAYAVHAVLQPLFDLVPRSDMGPGANRQFVEAVLAGRATSIVMSVATVYLVFRLGRAVDGKYTGLIAAGFVALSGLLIELAHFATPDSTTIFLLTACLWAAVEHVKEPTGAHLVRTGVLAGLAAGTEYNMVLLVVPLLAAWFVSEARRLQWVLWALVGVVGAWLAVNPYAIVKWNAFFEAGLHSLRSRTVDSTVQYGDRWKTYGPAWLYVIRYPLGYGVGFAGTAWLVAGTVWALVRRTRFNTVLLAWILPYFVLVSLSPAKFMRYSAPLIPALSVLAAELVVFLVLSPYRWPRYAALAASLFALLYTTGYDAAYAQLFSQTDARAQAAQWVRNHVPAGTRIAFQEIPDGLLNLPYFVVRQRYEPCFSRFSVRRLAGPASYLLVDSYEEEAHPDTATSQVDYFLASLRRRASYREIVHIVHVPRLGPFSFPIGNSPHDWRYPAHSITIYAHTAPGTNVGDYCFDTLPEALKVLYVPPPQ